MVNGLLDISRSVQDSIYQAHCDTSVRGNIEWRRDKTWPNASFMAWVV